MNTHLTFLHLERRKDRLENIMQQIEEQGIESWTIVEGFEDRCASFRGINQSHKRIVRLAKQQGMSNAIVSEDDIKFTHKGAWQYFLNQIPESYDMFFASFYEGKVDENNRLIKTASAKELLSGMTLYSIHSRFYDTFLSINEMSHIDKSIGELADKYEFYVAPEFCAIQMNGYSDNKKKECNYDKYMRGRKLFGVNS